MDTSDQRATQLYHGTRAILTPGALIEPCGPQDVASGCGTAYVYLTPTLDAAIWEAELAVGEGPGKVYVVEPVGSIEDAANVPGQKPPGRPWMAWRSHQPLRVISEVTEWRLFHGTRADL